MSQRTQRLNRKHLAQFEWYVTAFACHFGLNTRWAVHVDWIKQSEQSKSRADIWYDCAGRRATIRLNRDSSDTVPMSERLIAEAACHEVCHMLLAALADYAEEGAPRCINLIDVEHEIVNTLVHIALRDHFPDMQEACPHKV